MIRKTTRERLDDVVEVATRLFLTHGYRRTTMAMVAEEMELTEPAIYRYAEGKEALFDLVLRRAVQPSYVDGLSELPYSPPDDTATLEYVADVLEEEARLESLERALDRSGGVVDGRTQLRSILEELFDRTARFHLALKLVERSALDWPELAELWFGRVRRRLLEQLTGYLRREAAEADAVRPLTDPAVSARLVLEVVAYFAVHRHTDPFPPRASAATLRTVAIDHVVDGLCPG